MYEHNSNYDSCRGIFRGNMLEYSNCIILSALHFYGFFKFGAFALGFLFSNDYHVTAKTKCSILIVFIRQQTSVGLLLSSIRGYKDE